MHSRGRDLVAPGRDPVLRHGLACHGRLRSFVVPLEQGERRAVDGREPDLGGLTKFLDDPGERRQGALGFADPAELAQLEEGHEVRIGDSLALAERLGNREHLLGDRPSLIRVLRPPRRPESCGERVHQGRGNR